MPHTPIGAPTPGAGGTDGFPYFAPFDAFRGINPPAFVVDGLLEENGLSALIGAPGTGKSAVVIDMGLSICAGVPWKGRPTKRTRVLYIAGEGVSGAVQRVQAWETQHGIGVGTDLFMIPEAVLLSGTSADVWEWLAANIKANGIGLVIFDTLARMAVGLDENSAQDMGRAVGIFDKLRKHSGAGVLIVHHTKRGAETARGSSSLFGALDSELLVRHAEDEDDADEDTGGVVALEVVSTKQKNAAFGDVTPVWLRPAHGSVIVTDASGGTGDDPFSAMVVRPTRQRSSTDELAVRIWSVLADFPQNGLTRAELADVLAEDRGHEAPGRGEILRALERATATGLVSAEGARYKRGYNDLEHARGAGLQA